MKTGWAAHAHRVNLQYCVGLVVHDGGAQVRLASTLLDSFRSNLMPRNARLRDHGLTGLATSYNRDLSRVAPDLSGEPYLISRPAVVPARASICIGLREKVLPVSSNTYCWRTGPQSGAFE